jgi:FkbM family methyltransferase
MQALPLHVIAERISALSLKAAARLGFWGDLDMLQAIVAPYLRAGGPGTLLDVGACMGAMSAPLLHEGWRAVMFEPDPRCHEQIARLTAAFPVQARLEKCAVATDGRQTVTFHLANAPGLSGLSQSPFQGDAAIIEVPAIALSAYVAREGLHDVRFIKIDAEGYDLAILDSLDFKTLRPRLVMVEFGEHFPGQGRAEVTAAMARMDAQGYGACVVCLRPAHAFADQDWRTQLHAITVDRLPAAESGTTLMGNILFFPRNDAVFLPSVLGWLEALTREAQEPISAYGQDTNEMW